MNTDPNITLLEEVEKNSPRGVIKALQDGADINYIKNSKFALKLSAQSDKYHAVAKLLLENGANIDLVGDNNISALMEACKSGSVKIASLLLDKGACVDLRDSDGNTALMNLCADTQMAKSTFNKLARLLIDHGKESMQGEVSPMLMIACEKENCKAVKFLIWHGADVNFQDFNGNTALILACKTGNVEIVTFLLAKGAHVNYRDFKGRTALMRLCAGSELVPMFQKLAEILIRHQAIVDDQDNDGKTALMLACENNHCLAAEYLIEHGAAVSHQDRNGKSILMVSDKLDIVYLLLEHGAVSNIRDSSGQSLDREILKLIQNNGEQLTLRDDQGRTVLMRECQSSENDAEFVLFLINKIGNRAIINFQDNNGVSALMMACERFEEQSDVVCQFIKKGADVNAKDNQGQTSLMRTSITEIVEHTKLLLEYGAQVDTQDVSGTSALMLACKHGLQSETAKILVKNRAQIDAQDSAGHSALMFAVQCTTNCSLEVTQMLLDSGAQVDLQDNEQMTALIHAIHALALERHRDDVKVIINKIILLFKNRAEFKVSKLHHSLTSKLLRELKVADKASALLILLCENGNRDAVEVLLSSMTEINSRDSKGRTALIAASENGHSAIVDLLIEGGACVDLQDNEGHSALMAACRNGHVQVASHLLDTGVDTFLKDNKNMTALDIAVEKNSPDMLRLFAKLRWNSKYPGIMFSEGVKRESIVTESKTIDLKEVGISLSIPKDSLSSTDPPLELEIRPCFSGPFEAPQGVELVSPAYIVKPSRKVSFKKEVLVKIWHHANLESEEDCEDMVFLFASTTPEYRGDSPVYVFREIRGAKGLFRPGEEQPAGEIALRHFCTLALGKRKREGEETESEESVSKRAEGNLYSARLYIYRAVEKKLVFCICLYQPQYVKNCNKVIAAKCGVPEKKINPDECFNGVKIISTEVHLRQTCDSGWSVMFKKRPASILKEEISTQELYDISDLLEMDYPPKIDVVIQSVPDSPDGGPLCLHVEGLDRESVFILHISDICDTISPSTLSLDTSTIKFAMSNLREELQEPQSQPSTPVTTLLPTAAEMLSIMETVEQQLWNICSHTDFVMSVLLKLDKMERKSEQLKGDALQISNHLKQNYNMDIYVERANTFAVQMRRVFMANMAHCHGPEWQSAVGLFVTNAANLMTTIKDTLRAAKWALTLPNNYTPPMSSPPVAAHLPQTLHTKATTFPRTSQPSDFPCPPFSVTTVSSQKPPLRVSLKPHHITPLAGEHEQGHNPEPLPQNPVSPSNLPPPVLPQLPLTKDHTAAVCRCLYPLRAKWKTIGTFLLIDHNTLLAIRADNDDSADRLTELIAVWLRRHTPPPTWQALADAVQNIDPDKAQEIRTEMGR